MYKVSIFNNSVETIINYPSTEMNLNYLEKMDLIQNAGQVSNFNFTITSQNSGYNLLTNMVTLIIVEDFQTGEVLFDGRIYDAEENISSDGLFYKDVKCEDEMSYLNDTCVRAWNITSETPTVFLQTIIDNHNSHTTSDKQFTLGNIEYDNEITCQTKFENSLNCIISNIVNSIGKGYLRVRKINGIRYLDYVQLYEGSSDDIVLGQNMKDLKWKKDTTNIITRAVVVGKDNLTITTVNNGKDYLDNAEAIGDMGIIEGKLEFTDIDDATTLMNTAKAELPNLAKAEYQLSSNIIDLNKLGINPYGFCVGTDVNIIADAIGFNDSFTIITVETDLLDPAHTKITLDNKFGSITNRQLALQRYAQILQSCLTANKNINTFSLEGIIDSLKNQIQASGSFSNAQVVEGKGILLENTNVNSTDYGALYLGCGIFAIANTKVNGLWDWRTFGTGHGFVADEITSGIINANLIRTGTITSLDGSFSISLDDGHWTTYGEDNGYKALDMINRTINFYSFLTSGKLIGGIQSVEQSSTIDGMELGINDGTFFDLAQAGTTGTSTTVLQFNNNVNGTTNLISYIPFSAHIDNNHEFNISSNGTNLYGGLQNQGWDIDGVGNLNCVNLSVSGSKSCRQETNSFGDKLFYAYEFGEHYLGEMVFGQIHNGQALVYGNGLIQECINMDIDYHCKFYPYESCDYKIEKNQGYILITADRDIEFSLEIMAKRRGFENIRLEDAEHIGNTLNQPNKINSLSGTLDRNSTNIDLGTELLNGLNLNTNLLEVS